MKKITIIGGGLSGTLVALNLLRSNSNKEISIILIDKKSVGAGTAYSTEQSIHLLNVQADNMSLFPEEPLHFVNWLNENNFNYLKSDFVPRSLYGFYVREIFEKTIKNKSLSKNLEIINDEALDIVPNSNSCLLKLKSGMEIESDNIILAFGNFYSSDLGLKDNSYSKHPDYYANPWDSSLYENLHKDEIIFIIGTGLTMIDIVLSLHHNNHKGKIIALSKHGFIPFSHKPAEPYPSFYDELENKNLVEMLRLVREHIRKGKDWRGVIDSLKPYIQKIWIDLPLTERKIFLEHLKHFWNTARHRVPQQCSNIIEQLMSTNQLVVEAGRIKKITPLNNKFEIKSSVRKTGNKIFNADVIIKCAGIESDYEKINIPLIKNLFSRDLIRKDPLSLGLDAQIDGRIIEGDGRSSKYLFTIGQPLLGVLWETTAVPEIRVQAKQLASILLKN